MTEEIETDRHGSTVTWSIGDDGTIRIFPEAFINIYLTRIDVLRMLKAFGRLEPTPEHSGLFFIDSNGAVHFISQFPGKLDVDLDKMVVSVLGEDDEHTLHRLVQRLPQDVEEEKDV